MHAYTNSAHPTASAVGLRNLQIIEDEKLVENAQVMGQHLSEGLQNIFANKKNISNIRTLGFIAGFTLVEDADSNTNYDPTLGMGSKFAKFLREECGVITRFVGDQIVLAPPLITNHTEIEFLLDGLDRSLQSIQ
jgi:putrescine aminotransferase